MKILGSIVTPALLLLIGWRGIAPEKRKGALRVILIMLAVITLVTAIYILVMIEMTPKWTAKDCDAAYEEIAQSPQSTEPTLAREPFLAACNHLPMSAAQCTRLSFVTKFPESCERYIDEIHGVLPKLNLKIQKLAK